VALSASRNNIKAVIVMPLATPQIKVRLCHWWLSTVMSVLGGEKFKSGVWKHSIAWLLSMAS
jgi:threonine dehydratase